MNDAVKKNHLS